MAFASAYLNEKTIFPRLIDEAPDRNTGIITIVPSYNETGITRLLDSFYWCMEPPCSVEIIIVVNAPENAGVEEIEVNRKTIKEAKEWITGHSDTFFRVYPLTADSAGIKNWGVGLARKTGMDEAVRRFDTLDRPDGIILNIDADCTVDKNYFTEVYKELSGKNDRSACSIYFEHPVRGNSFAPSVYNSILLYELHLRYYYQGLLFTGFPYAHHTVGSAVAVKTLPYIKSGGMNRKMAGEDFYFIQKLALAGGYFDLNETTVFPSPRPSSRVPFGTGTTITRMSENGNKEFLTYNLDAFRELKFTFRSAEVFFRSKTALNNELYDNLPYSLRSFINPSEWNDKINEIIGNTAAPDSSIKRFYDWFNMFRIVKYMNSVHQSVFKKLPVVRCAYELLTAKGTKVGTKDPGVLLEKYRFLEKNS